MSLVQRPKTDIGTVVLHWLLVGTLLGAMYTGLSIAAADDPNSWLVQYFGFLLSGEELWYRHLSFGVALISTFAAYAVYIRKAGLFGRIRFGAGRLTALFRPGQLRWASVNIVLYWLLFLSLTFSIVTGVLLFFGYGRIILTLHLHSVWVFLAFLFVHPLAHWLYGGDGQLLRIVKPSWRLPQHVPLVDALIGRIQELETGKELREQAKAPPNHIKEPMRQKTMLFAGPLAIAVLAGTAIGYLGKLIEKPSRQTLRIVKISPANAPPLDGEISGSAWRRAAVTVVETQHGANFEHGDSRVEIRALHDGRFAYFAFIWTDPTRSLKHMPLLKKEDGWHLMRTAAPGNETQYFEDKFAVLLTAVGAPLIGKGIHLGRQPLSDKPAGATGRGLHYVEGGMASVWEWRASHGGMLGFVDSGHFGPPRPASERNSGRYSGGFFLKSRPYQENFEIISDQERYPLVRPRRVPNSAARILKAQSLDLGPESSDADSSFFWLTASDSVAFSDELDREIPVGSMIPSVMLLPDEAARAEATAVVGSARWAGGRWCLELRRRLETGSPADVVIKTGALMWVAAFDHAETWHTYHVRPLELEVEE